MKEAYLHFVWALKRLPFHQMKLTNGKSVLVKSTGIYNKESGPDFFDGEVLIDGISWRGNIELHVKSSDWNLHNHHTDKAYENVILHVVYEHDRDVVVHNQLLPTLELKNHLEEKHYLQFLEMASWNNAFPCASEIANLDVIYLESMKEKALIDRLNRKVEFLNRLENGDYGQILYLFLANALGTKVNSVPFQELTHRLPLKIIKRESTEVTTALILGMSGCLGNSRLDLQLKNEWDFLKKKYELTQMDAFVWKKKGLRPASFPYLRLFQFSRIIQKFDFNLRFIMLRPDELLVYLNAFLTISKEKDALNLSTSMKELIIMNCFVPFIWWYGEVTNDYNLKMNALELLNRLSPEDNSILKMWKQVGVKIKKAYDSQALLEIYTHFCKEKKCLSCTVGNKIMDKG